VDWKAEYSALSSTRSQKKKLKQPTQCPFNTVQVKIREYSMCDPFNIECFMKC